MSLAYLIDPQNQYMTKSGTINVCGVLRVYDASTDDAAVTYCDFNGTENEESIVLDNNGRAVVIADSDKAYRVEVYDRYGTLMWTITPIWCLAGGGGVTLKVTEIVSSDGSIAVDKTTVGSTTTFDLTIAPDNASELLEWVKCGLDNVSDGYVYPDYAEGTMETFLNKGLQVFGNRYYHVTSHFKVTPTGNGIDYDTVSVALMFSVDGGSPVELCRRDFDVDNSLNDTLTYEFAYDFINEADGYLYWSVTGASMVSQLDCTMQAHRVYSGINAVPGSIASKVWVNQQISSKIDYSALEYNSDNEITAINGSSLAGGGSVDPTQFIPWSASGSFQPSGSYLSASDASSFYPMTGNPSSFVTDSSLSAYQKVADMSAYQPSGDYAFNSSLSAKLDASASSQFTLTADMSAYQTTADMSAYAFESSNSAKLDASASSMFAPSGNYQSALTFGYDGNNKISSIDGSAIGGQYSGIYPVVVDNTAETIAVDNIGMEVDDTMTAYVSGDNMVIGVRSGLYASESAMSSKLDSSAFSAVSGTFLTAVPSSYATESYVDSVVSSKLDSTAYNSAQFILTSQSGLFQPSGYYQPSGDYLSATESSNYYSTSNPSGFITGIDLSDYQKTADMSGFIPTSESSNYQQTGSMSAYQETANMTAYIPVSALGLVEI